MRLLLITQIVDTKDTYLGFFHRWIEELAQHFEAIEVICLYEGSHALPGNVRVHSLGKDAGRKGTLTYALRFLSLAWRLRSRYDRVFVHMNEEYVLLGGFLWKLMGRPVYLWRNHYAGSWKTGIAALLSRKVFYTSAHSYTARYRNAVRMPVGVDVQLYQKAHSAQPRSILFFGRFSPSKRPDVFIEALGLLKAQGVPFRASVYGSALPADMPYRARVIDRAHELGLDTVSFHEGVPHAQTADIFGRHEVYVNLADSGMLDKMLFEAAASGAKVLARSEDWRELAGDGFYISGVTPEQVADAIARALDTTAMDLTGLAQEQSLPVLVPKLSGEMA